MTRHSLIRGVLGPGWGAVLTVSVLCGPARGGQIPEPDPAEASAPRVRPLDARAEAALRQGVERSTVVRELVAALDDGDLVVYIQTAQLQTRSLLTFMAAAPTRRFVRISLDFRSVQSCMVGWLGHELQHAVEVAGASDVRDQQGLERLFKRIGERSSSGGWCTRAAQHSGAAVLVELRASCS